MLIVLPVIRNSGGNDTTTFWSLVRCTFHLPNRLRVFALPPFADAFPAATLYLLVHASSAFECLTRRAARRQEQDIANHGISLARHWALPGRFLASGPFALPTQKRFRFGPRKIARKDAAYRRPQFAESKWPRPNHEVVAAAQKPGFVCIEPNERDCTRMPSHFHRLLRWIVSGQVPEAEHPVLSAAC
jgi:hypothetical protein